jgi:hypothetical protein
MEERVQITLKNRWWAVQWMMAMGDGLLGFGVGPNGLCAGRNFERLDDGLPSDACQC